MHHRMKGRRFSRPTSQRKALLMNLAVSLIEHEQITTTLPKAKDLRSYVEKLITMARKDTLHARRLLLARLRNESVVTKMLTVLKSRYDSRPGGYTRVLKAGFRQGDQAPLAVIELVDRPSHASQAAAEPAAEKSAS